MTNEEKFRRIQLDLSGDGGVLLIDTYNERGKYTDVCGTLTIMGNTNLQRCGTFLVVEKNGKVVEKNEKS